MFGDLLPVTEPGAVFAVLLLLVLAGPMLATRLKLPALVGLIAVGMLVGPNVLGIVDGSVLIDALGFVGLLYLMFQGGLDLDLDGFAARRRESVLFGVLTLVIPLVLVTWAATVAEVPWLAAVIIASALTSHTPLSYPTIARFDLSRNRAVTASLGATLIATLGALLVLAVAAAAAEGGTSTFDWIVFLAGLVGFTGVMIAGVPRMTRSFFRSWGQDRDVRLTYLLSGMGFAAVLAGVLGIAPIVGAFLAGLAFNRFVPDGTLIADRVDVLGRSLFVPAFLVSTGMMLDPVALVTDPRTLTLGAVLVVAEVGSKWVAAELSGRIIRVSRPERGLMFSLSVGQAAGALAAVVVGEEIGLLGPAEVNAVILVILVSALLSGLSAERNAPRVEPPGLEGRSIGKRVVVPVSNPANVEALVRVAGNLAAPDSGAVVAVNVLPFDARPEQVRVHRDLGAQAERAALATGAEVRSSVRIDASIDGGVLHSVVEQEGTALVMGWDGQAGRSQSLFGTVIDRCVAVSPVPVLVCRPGDNGPTRRVLLPMTEEEFAPGYDRSRALVLEVAKRLSRQAEVPAIVITDLSESLAWERLDGNFEPDQVLVAEEVLEELGGRQQPGDVIVSAAPPTSGRLGRWAARVAEAAPERTVVIAIPR